MDFQRGRPFGTWLRAIALNAARNYLRARTRHAKLATSDQLGEVAAVEGRQQGVLSGILRQEISDRISTAVSQLPETMREAFVLHHVEQLSYEEIAELTGEAVGTLRVRAHRACLLLRDALGSVVDTWLLDRP
jgi:RNA polymerase sigma-70 factor (ECF subfamily)